MAMARKRCKLTDDSKLWELNKCVTCTRSLDSTSKLLSCLHAVCSQCIKFNFDKHGDYLCKCKIVTKISNELPNCTLICEKFDKSIIRNNYMGEEYQKKLYGKYSTKAPCPNCDDKCVEIYCITCDKSHCALCQLLSHKSHQFKPIHKVMEETRSNLMKNKIDLCDKLNFAYQAKSSLASDMKTLKKDYYEIRKEIVDNIMYTIRLELSKTETKMMTQVDMYYKAKMDDLIRNQFIMDGLTKKYDFYLYFSESALKKENKADLDITNLIDNQLLNVRKGFLKDINGLDTTFENIDLKVKLDDTVNQLIDSVRRLIISKPIKYEKAIAAITKTINITLCPGYERVNKMVEDIPKTIDSHSVDNIIKYNCMRLERKRSKLSTRLSLHSNATPIYEIQNQNQYFQNRQRNIVPNNLNVQLNVFEQNIEEDEEIVSHKSGIKDPFKSLSCRQFIELYRLSKDLAKRVINIVTPYMKAPTRYNSMTIKQKVMTALGFFASGNNMMDIYDSSFVSQSSVSRAIEEVMNALCCPEIFEKIVHFPKSVEELNSVQKGFYDKFNVQDIVGIVGCTHIAIAPYKTKDLPYPEEEYVNTKGYFSINTQLICDVNLRILNVSARYPGSSHDSHIWNTSEIKTLMIDLNSQYKSYILLGDSRYGLSPWLLTPFLDPCPDTPQANYNDNICKAISTIERCNVELKKRFRCLLKYRGLHYAPNKATKIIKSCVVLHNLCIMDNTPLYNEDFDTQEVDYGMFQQNHDKNTKISDKDNPELTAGQQVRQHFVHLYFT